MAPLFQANALALDPPLTALPPLSFALRGGYALRLVGPSGSGKSTVLRALARLGGKRAGELRLRGVPADEIAPAHWRRQVAYLPQNPVMLPGDVQENLAAGFRTRNRSQPPFDEQRSRTLMGRLGLRDEALLSRNAQLLSGGEAARVALCRALLLDPVVLLADEISSQLDSGHAGEVVALCADFLAAGGAMVLVAHTPAAWDALSGPLTSVSLADAPTSGGARSDGSTR